MQENLTTEEKIDYIYNSMKKSQTKESVRFWIKIIFYILSLWYIAYFYFFGFAQLKQELMNSFKPDVSGTSDKVMESIKNSGLLEKVKIMVEEQKVKESEY